MAADTNCNCKCVEIDVIVDAQSSFKFACVTYWKSVDVHRSELRLFYDMEVRLTLLEEAL
jgi:hypothetical protein